MKQRILALVVLTLSTPPSWAAIGRGYDLYTLDHRTAAGLVMDICKATDEKPQNCRVDVQRPGQISVYAELEVHDRIVRALAERDPQLPPSLTYQIVLVRAAAGGRQIGELSVAPHVRKALEGARQLLALDSFSVIDQGLVQLSDVGATYLKGSSPRPYAIRLSHRSAITNDEGTYFTLEIEVGHPADGSGPASKILNSVLTLKEGETVIAGTSALRTGDGALLVLVTSVDL